MLPRVLGAVVTAITLLGCSQAVDDSGGRTASAEAPSPRLGGGPLVRSQPPSAPMDRLELAVARRLSEKLRRDRVTVEYLDCPRWRAGSRQVMTCDGYFDGVPGRVRVVLGKASEGAADFAASLTGGVIATQNLVERLRAEGYDRVDCGDRPTYAAEVGAHLVCAVTDHGSRRNIVATVTDRSGAVEIGDY